MSSAALIAIGVLAGVAIGQAVLLAAAVLHRRATPADPVPFVPAGTRFYERYLLRRRDRRVFTATVDGNLPSPATVSAFIDLTGKAWCRVQGPDGQRVDSLLDDFVTAFASVSTSIDDMQRRAAIDAERASLGRPEIKRTGNVE